MGKLTHADDEGKARMVDVGDKPMTDRMARVRGRIAMNEDAYRALRENRLAKGDALAVARLAGIQAAKRTADWIPLCHSIPLDRVEIRFDFRDPDLAIDVEAEARAHWKTGVEMEALIAVQAALAAIYDMAKALDRGMRIDSIRLVEKRGGRSGHWRAPSEAGS